MSLIIDLEEHFGPKVSALTHFADGHKLRYHYDLNQVDKQKEKVEIIFPHYIWNVSYSFFRGLLFDSYKKLDKEKFSKHYSFEAEERLMSIINGCIEDLHNYLHAPQNDELVEELTADVY